MPYSLARRQQAKQTCRVNNSHTLCQDLDFYNLLIIHIAGPWWLLGLRLIKKNLQNLKPVYILKTPDHVYSKS